MVMLYEICVEQGSELAPEFRKYKGTVEFLGPGEQRCSRTYDLAPPRWWRARLATSSEVCLGIMSNELMLNRPTFRLR